MLGPRTPGKVTKNWEELLSALAQIEKSTVRLVLNVNVIPYEISCTEYPDIALSLWSLNIEPNAESGSPWS
jgi:hypothetical protein